MDFVLSATSDLLDIYRLHEWLMVMKVPVDSPLIAQTLKESRLGDVLGESGSWNLTKRQTIILPEPQEILQSGDWLVVEGRIRDLEILQGLEDLEIERRSQPEAEKLVSDNVGLVEAILSPHTTLAGKTLRQLNFREKYGLNVLAIWRRVAHTRPICGIWPCVSVMLTSYWVLAINCSCLAGNRIL